MVAGVANNAVRGEKNPPWFSDPVNFRVNFGSSQALTAFYQAELEQSLVYFTPYMLLLP